MCPGARQASPLVLCLRKLQEAGNGVSGPEHGMCEGSEVREAETECSTSAVHSLDREREEEAV